MRPDPRASASDGELVTWVSTQANIAGLFDDVLMALEGARDARAQVARMATRYDDAEFQTLADAAVAAIDAWELHITELKHETFEDEDAWVMKLDGQLRHLLDVVEDGGAPVTQGALERLSDLEAEWGQRREALARIAAAELAAVNRWAREAGLPHVPSPEQRLGRVP